MTLRGGAGHLLLRGDRLDRIRNTRTQKAARTAGGRLILGLPWGVMPAVVRGNRQWAACPPALEVAVIFFYFEPLTVNGRL